MSALLRLCLFVLLMLAIQSWVITVRHYLLLLVLLLRSHLLLILLILMHLARAAVLLLTIVSDARLLHNKRTIWRLHSQVLFWVLLLVNHVCYLLLLCLLVEARVRVDHHGTALNYGWLFLIAGWRSSFSLLIYWIVLWITVDVHVAVHLLLL